MVVRLDTEGSVPHQPKGERNSPLVVLRKWINWVYLRVITIGVA